MIKSTTDLSVLENFKKIMFGDLLLHIKTSEIFESDDSEKSEEEEVKITNTQLDAADTERGFFHHDEVHPKDAVRLPGLLDKNDKPYSAMPKTDKGFDNLQTAEGIELVPNSTRLNPKSTKGLVKKFEKGAFDKGESGKKKRFDDKITVSTGFTSSGTKI